MCCLKKILKEIMTKLVINYMKNICFAIKEIIKKAIWFVKSDVELQTKTYWLKGKEYVDSFYFYSKKPFSKSYQYHASIGLENTYKVLELIQKSIKRKSKALLQIYGSLGREDVYIYKDSLKKAEKQMLEMIKKIQKQY